MIMTNLAVSAPEPEHLRPLACVDGCDLDYVRAQVGRLMAQGALHHLQRGPGETLWRHGRVAEELVFCLRGTLKVVLPEEHAPIIRLVMSGELADLAPFAPGGVCYGDLITVTDCSLLCADRAAVLRWVGDGPQNALAVLCHNARVMNRAQRRIAALSGPRVSQRLARMLLLFMERTGEEDMLRLHLSQEELAGLVGARRETVARQLSVWRKHGVLDWGWREVRILSREALEAEAGA